MIDPVLGTLLGTAVGATAGFLGQWLLAKRQESKSRTDRVRDNLEDLHLRVEEYSGICRNFMLVTHAQAYRPEGSRQPTQIEYDELAAMLREPLPILRSISKRYASKHYRKFDDLMNAAAEVYVAAPAVLSNQVSAGELIKRMTRLQIACDNFNHQIEKQIAEM